MPHNNATCLNVDGFWCVNVRERAEQNLRSPRSPEVSMAGMESGDEVRNLRKQNFGRGGTGGWG